VKKIFVLPLLLLCLVPLCAQNLAGIDKWILNFPAGKTDFAGYKITRCVIERTGALVVADNGGTAVRLNIIKPIELETLTAKYRLVEKAILTGLVTEARAIVVKECEIDFGLKDEMTVTLKLASFRFRLNTETILELIGRLETAPVFYAQPQGGELTYALRFKGIDPGTGDRDVFPGWLAYVGKLVQWFQKGLNDNNQETMSAVLETKVMKFEDRQTKKVTGLSDQKSNLWIGFNVNYLMSNIIAAAPTGISAYPGYYNQLQPMIYLDWRNLGQPEWLAKPYRISLALGGFFEFNAGYFGSQTAGEYVGYPEGLSSFMIAWGPSVGVTFDAMIPRIINNEYSGDLFGLGIELLFNFNLPYFFPEYAYEYFLVSYVNFVIHILPINSVGLDILAGFDLSFATLGYDETAGGFYVSKYGFTLGARFRLDFWNFNKTGE
jgi:hypothetical protein